MRAPTTRTGGRRATTLVEVLIASTLFVLVFLIAWRLMSVGRRAMWGTGRKLDATRLTHLRFEAMRHDLVAADWVWVPKPPPPDEVGPGDKEDPVAVRNRALGGGNTLYTQGREYVFDPKKGSLVVNGQAIEGKYSDVRFFSAEPFVVKFLVAADAGMQGPPEKVKTMRQSSTLVSKVFADILAQEVRERQHEWERGWGVEGDVLQLGFTE